MLLSNENSISGKFGTNRMAKNNMLSGSCSTITHHPSTIFFFLLFIIIIIILNVIYSNLFIN